VSEGLFARIDRFHAINAYRESRRPTTSPTKAGSSAVARDFGRDRLHAIDADRASRRRYG
jgi:hypothetical protein